MQEIIGFSIICDFACKCQTPTTTIYLYPLCTLGADQEYACLDHFPFKHESYYGLEKSSEQPIDMPKLFHPGGLSILPIKQAYGQSHS